MTAGNKFLGVAGAFLAIPIVYRVAPEAAILMVVLLLALACVVCRDDDRP
jgi:hypothetical protein